MRGSQMSEKKMGDELEESTNFNFMYNKHKGEVFRHCQRFARNREEAEDAFQQAWMQFYMKEVAPENPIAWLKITARNYIFDCGRGRNTVWRKWNLVREFLSSIVFVRQDKKAPDKELIRQENIVRICKLLEQLNDNHRKILTLYHIEGLSHDEIAARTNRKPASIPKILRRARKALKKAHERQNNELR